VTLLTGLDPEKVAFAGDWHGNTRWAVAMIRAARRNGVDAIVQAGDFGFDFSKNFVHAVRYALEDNNLELIFADGNHDHWRKLNEKWVLDKETGFRHSPYGGRGADRLHYSPRGNRWTWNGKVFMTLGGAVSVDRNWRTPFQTWWPEETITISQAEYAARPGKVDVMVCHDLCSSAMMPNDRKSHGWPEDALRAAQQHREMIQAVVDDVHPELFVHGHFHSFNRQMVGSMKVVSLDCDSRSIGTPGHFNGNMIFVNADLTEYEPEYLPTVDDLFPILDNQ
jgi:Icc-related predicted phosphoesterase